MLMVLAFLGAHGEGGTMNIPLLTRLEMKITKSFGSRVVETWAEKIIQKLHDAILARRRAGVPEIELIDMKVPNDSKYKGLGLAQLVQVLSNQTTLTLQ